MKRTYQPRVPNALTVHAIKRIVHSCFAQQLRRKGAAQAGHCFPRALDPSSNERRSAICMQHMHQQQATR